MEEIKRSQKRQWLNEQSLKLGRFLVQRAGNQIIEVWEDGDDVIKVKNRLQKIIIDKYELEKVRNKLNQILGMLGNIMTIQLKVQRFTK